MPQRHYRDAIRCTIIMERDTAKLIKAYAESQGFTMSRYISLHIENLVDNLDLKESEIEPLNSARNRRKRLNENNRYPDTAGS